SGFGFNTPGIVSNCVSYPTTYVGSYYTDSFNVEPRFVDSAGADGVIGTADDDLRLQPGSPLIDRGAADLLSNGHSTDLAGAPRRRDDPAAPNVGTGGVPHVDVGAFER
ncbi:MAG: choice-of-anchor Q domain-containing protein, partial [Planctomycetota bacterium]